MRIAFSAFGDLRRYLPEQKDVLALDVEDGITVAELLQRLGVDWGEVGIVAVNGKLSNERHRLRPGDLVETFDPVGGG